MDFMTDVNHIIMTNSSFIFSPGEKVLHDSSETRRILNVKAYALGTHILFSFCGSIFLLINKRINFLGALLSIILRQRFMATT